MVRLQVPNIKVYPLYFLRHLHIGVEEVEGGWMLLLSRVPIKKAKRDNIFLASPPFARENTA
jgi:hypothetical protein